MSDGFDEIVKHQNGESQKMKATKGFGQSFEVTCQSTETGSPHKTAFDDPASGQQHKDFLGFRQLNRGLVINHMDLMKVFKQMFKSRSC